LNSCGDLVRGGLGGFGAEISQRLGRRAVRIGVDLEKSRS
jgi:hypothetical protein